MLLPVLVLLTSTSALGAARLPPLVPALVLAAITALLNG